MKSMGAIALAGLIATMGFAPIALADGVIIPGSIMVNHFKELMLAHGMRLNGEDDSDGYVENKGTQIKVITYRPVTIEQMEWMKEAATKSLRRV